MFGSTEALRGSTVKIAGRDVLATWKLLVGLGFLPTLYGFYTLVVLFFMLRTNLDWQWKVFIPLATWTLLPFVSYASLRFGEIGMDVFRSLAPLYLALVDPDGVRQLRDNREKLSHDLTEIINEYGPKAFSDYDPDNIFSSAIPLPLGHRTSRASETPAAARRE